MADSGSGQALASLTPRDQEVVMAALQNLKSGEIQIDYNGLAAALGLKDAKSACAVWSSVKKKLFGNKNGPVTATVASPKANAPRKTATPRAKKAAVATANKDVDKESADAEDGTPAPDGDVSGASDANVNGAPATPKTPATPKKRVRKTKAEKAAEAAANGETPAAGDDEEEDEKPPAKKRRTPVKKKAAANEVDEVADEECEAKATPTKAKKVATPRKPKSEKEPTPPAPTPEALTVAEAAKVKKEENAAAAAEANDVLLSKRVVTPNLPALEVAGVEEEAA